MSGIQNFGIRRSFEPAEAQTQNPPPTKAPDKQGRTPVDVATLSAAALSLTGSDSRLSELRAAVEAGRFEADSTATASKIIAAALMQNYQPKAKE